MDFIDRQSTPVYEEKSCDETTVFINENGSVSKRRRRKSLGRRVSFAEAPSLHIFPRDDEYETPTRASNAGVGSPHKVGERRSPRLAAKVHDDDKENRVLTSNSGSRRRRGASKSLSARGGGSPVLKPQNWLDPRDCPSQAGSDEENTGPVDLRHLSFEQKEGEVDDENMTLDSTTFALKFSLQRNRNDEPVVVQLDKNSSALTTVEAVPDEDVLEKDMSFTMNRPVLRRKSVNESQTGFGEMSSDMSLTMQVLERRRKPYILTGDDVSVDEDSMVLSNQRLPATRNSSLPGSRDDSSALVIYSHDVQSSPVPLPKSVDVRAQIEERWGKDIGDDEIKVTTGNEENLDATETVDMSVSSLSVCSSTGHEDHSITVGIPSLRHLIREEEDEEMRHEDRRISMDIPSLRQLIREEEDDEMREEDRSTTSGVPSLKQLIREEEDDELRDEDQSITRGVPSLKHLIREEEDEEVRMAGAVFDATHRARETLNPAEDAELMLTEAEFTGPDSPPKDVVVRSTSLGSTELQRERETLNPSEDAEMMLAEEEFTGTHHPLKDVDERSTDVSSMELQGVTETLNPKKDAELMLREGEFTRTDSPPKDVDVSSTDVSFEDWQRVREMQSPSTDSKMGKSVDITPVMHKARETHNARAELDLSDTQRAEENFSTLEDAEMSLTGIDMQKGRETNNLQMNVDGVNDVVFRLTQEGKDTHNSSEFANTMATDVVSTRTSGGEELHDSAGNADEVQVCLTETTSAPQDADLGAAAADTTTLPEAQESQSPPQIVNRRMAVAAVEGLQNSDELRSPAVSNSEESPGSNLENRATKRPKFVRDVYSLNGKDSENVNSSYKNGYVAVDKGWMPQDDNSSPVLEGVTAQVPRFRDLLAADLNSANSTPVRPVSRSMWMTPPSSLTAARAHHESDVVMISSPERENGANGYLTSPTDSSMEIVEPTAHSLSASPIGATEESPKISDGQVPDIFAARGTIEDIPSFTTGKEKGVEPKTLTREKLYPQIPSSSLEEEQRSTPSSPRSLGSQQVIKATDVEKFYEMNEFDEPEVGSKLSDDKPARLQYRVQVGEGEGNNATNISVEEFLRHIEVQFSLGLQSPSELLKDSSLAATHHVRTLSECFHFKCVVQPKLLVMRAACGELAEKFGIKATAVAELEKRLTASNPAIFSFFQNARDHEKQQIKKQLERIQGNYRLLAEKDRLQFQQIVETAYMSRILEMKNMIMYYERHLQEAIDTFDEKCRRPLVCLQANLSSRDANWECASPFSAKVSHTGVDLRKKVILERIEDLKERLKDLGSSKELKLAKLRPREQAAKDTFRGLKQSLELTQNKLSALRSKVVDRVCSGKNHLPREKVAHSPHLYVQKIRGEVYLLDVLQDGFQVKSVGRENQDLVVELGYRSIVKRRYVVRKVGTAVKVLASSWALDTAKIEGMFPGVNALVAFSLALTTTRHDIISKTTAIYSNAWTQVFGRLSALEAVRFTLPSVKSGGIPEPTDLRASMQVTRMLVGNLMDLMEEVGKCQPVVNASSGGGILGETRFRNAPDGQLQLELKFIDIVSSIKFFVILDMSCLSLNGYPLGDLKAKVEVEYCAPPSRHRFKAETLEDSLSLVKPGYQRLVRTCAAVGTFLASLRRGG